MQKDNYLSKLNSEIIAKLPTRTLQYLRTGTGPLSSDRTLPIASLPLRNRFPASRLYFVSPTSCAIQNLVSSSISAKRYFILPFTLRHNSSALQVSPTFGLI